MTKNIIVFIGDGMGIQTHTLARIYKGQSRQGVSGEEASLAWETFPSMGLLKVRPMFIEPAKGGQSPEIMGTEVQTKRRTFERRFLSTAVAGNLNCKMGMLKIFEFSCSWHPYGAS